MAFSRSRALILLTFALLTKILEISACTGCVQLTEYTFDKVISKFDATLVKFDVAFPYGDKHESYSELAKDAKVVDELLVAEVGIKDYGERDNEEIAKKFGIKKDDYPVVKLFLKNKKEPLTFSSKKEFTTENLRKFVKEASGIHLSLPGCIAELDKIVFDFMKASEGVKKALMNKLESIISNYDKQVKAIGKVYQQIMQRVIEKGQGFVATENERVKKLLDGKISPEKKKELHSKLNILLSFVIKKDDKIKIEL